MYKKKNSVQSNIRRETKTKRNERKRTNDGTKQYSTKSMTKAGCCHIPTPRTQTRYPIPIVAQPFLFSSRRQRLTHKSFLSGVLFSLLFLQGRREQNVEEIDEATARALEHFGAAAM